MAESDFGFGQFLMVCSPNIHFSTASEREAEEKCDSDKLLEYIAELR